MKYWSLIFMACLGLLLSCGSSTQEETRVPVQGVSLSPTSLTLAPGETGRLTATVRPENATDPFVVWEGDNPDVATVSVLGEITALSDGEVHITVTTRDGGFTAQATLRVETPETPLPPTPVRVSSVSVSPTSLRLEQGQQAVLVARVLPEDAEDRRVSWESSDPEVATVSEEGQVLAIGTGQSRIRVTTLDGHFTADCDVEVVAPTNVIAYRTFSGTLLEPYSYSLIGRPVSNTYTDGWGMLVFDHTLTGIGDKNFYNCNLLTEMILPAEVTTIGNAAFSGCHSLSSIMIPEGVTSIGDEAFYNCYSLRRVTLPTTVQTVGSGAFSRCQYLERFDSALATEDGRCLLIDGKLIAFAPSGLTEYSVPDDVTRVGYASLKYCAKLQSLTLPASVQEIGDYALLNCSSLHSLNLLATEPPVLGEHVFEGVFSLYQVFVPAESLEAYRTAKGWRLISSRIQAME